MYQNCLLIQNDPKICIAECLNLKPLMKMLLEQLSYWLVEHVQLLFELARHLGQSLCMDYQPLLHEHRRLCPKHLSCVWRQIFLLNCWMNHPVASHCGLHHPVWGNAYIISSGQLVVHVQPHFWSKIPLYVQFYSLLHIDSFSIVTYIPIKSPKMDLSPHSTHI